MDEVGTGITLAWLQSSAQFFGPDPPSVGIPRQLGSVRLVREIGHGGMGVVWLARDEMLERDVAVKFLLGAVTSSDDLEFKRFLEGARAAAAVRHPALNIVHHADLIDGLPYLVMEYVNGPTLTQVLQRQGPLKPERALAIMLKVCEGIAELHDRGIVHRDIKPSNIMLNTAGEVCVTDFGIACGRIPLGASLRVEALAGTPAYMAPEMFEGSISQRGDVYALGATLFELLCGQSPFTGGVDELSRQHAHVPVPVERLNERGVPESLVSVIERAMNKTPMFRLKNARQLAMALGVAVTQSENAIAGEQELAALAGPGLREESSATAPPQEASSYHDQLSVFASRRRLTARDCEPPRLMPFTSAAISTDLMCVRCGYQLRGTRADGRCPECATPVSESTDPTSAMEDG
ncbi:MAG: serine/threonine protein kinase [Phycisphaerales bacterium]|nr:serine/threonine protein kinase [Phycisphaerales bacterium]MCI0631832.1 serine/threonine protein kinase [Phycisphaerales bacterium]MCI0674558.1 serine/threonine protein kinase [Phycisphaerales bacterium]